jgi:hypothetical protein
LPASARSGPTDQKPASCTPAGQAGEYRGQLKSGKEWFLISRDSLRWVRICRHNRRGATNRRQRYAGQWEVTVISGRQRTTSTVRFVHRTYGKGVCSRQSQDSEGWKNPNCITDAATLWKFCDCTRRVSDLKNCLFRLPLPGHCSRIDQRPLVENRNSPVRRQSFRGQTVHHEFQQQQELRTCHYPSSRIHPPPRKTLWT